MTKQEKEKKNKEIEREWNKASAEYDKEYPIKTSKQLRSCTALVYETSNYYFLQSYGTIIAFIDKATDTCYDVLRLVYGFTRTSAQHIAKFRHDYGLGKFGCEHELTYKN